MKSGDRLIAQGLYWQDCCKRPVEEAFLIKQTRTPRGWRITKDKQFHKIDVVTASRSNC
jgi:hypothetical protein